MLDELGHRVLYAISMKTCITAEVTYTRHELEDGILRFVEERGNLLQALLHCVVIAHSTSHTRRQLGAESMIDVELVGGSRGKESIV